MTAFTPSPTGFLDANRIALGLRGTLPVRSEIDIRPSLLNVGDIDYNKSEQAHDNNQDEYERHNTIPVRSPLQPFHRGMIAHPYVLKSRDFDAHHNAHNVRNREVTRGTNGSLSARDSRSRSRATSESGRNIGRTSGGTLSRSARAVFK